MSQITGSPRLLDRPACPPWCTHHTAGGDGYALHVGPHWLLDVADHDIELELELERGDEPTGAGSSVAVLITDGGPMVDLTADQLRELATYALAAAAALDGRPAGAP
jgi:hypothetical protein